MWCKTAIRLDASLLAVWTEFERTVGREEWTSRHVLSVAADALEKAGRTELAAAMRQRLD
ncbi:MAG: hypothetical protein JNM17_36910 [Archangium sp.]|nr:hypothetical protein [Archangium sp.]